MFAYRWIGVLGIGCLLGAVGCTKPQDPGKGFVGAPPGQLTDQYLQFQSASPIQFEVRFAVGGSYVNPCKGGGTLISSGGSTNMAGCLLNPVAGELLYEASITGAGPGPMIVRSCGGCTHPVQAVDPGKN